MLGPILHVVLILLNILQSYLVFKQVVRITICWVLSKVHTQVSGKLMVLPLGGVKAMNKDKFIYLAFSFGTPLSL